MPKVDKRSKKEWTINNLEIRTMPFEQNGQTVEQPVIAGYAAVYNSESEVLTYGPYQFREVIRPGAFDSSLNNDIRCLWNHNDSYVLGRSSAGTLNIRTDAKGLYFEVQPPNTQWANDLCESIRRKDVDQMSFGFSVNEDVWDDLEDGTEMRELIDVDMFEISVVTFPAYQATSAGMRSLDKEDPEVQKRFEERKKEKQGGALMGPDKKYLDHLKMLKALDEARGNGAVDPDGDPDYESPEEMKQNGKRAKAVDDADGGEPLDPGSEADDPNNNDTTDDDEGDENRSTLDPDDIDGFDPDENPEEDAELQPCDNCGRIMGADGVCPECG